MKKVFLVLFLLATISLFALYSDSPDQKSFNITTTIDPVTLIKIIAGSASTPSNESEFNLAQEKTSHTFTGAGSSNTLFLQAIVFTNLAQTHKLVVTAPHMSRVGGTSGDSKISYTFNSGTNGQYSGTNGYSFTLSEEGSHAAAARVFTTAFSITLSEVDYAEALSGTYKADITFEVQAP